MGVKTITSSYIAPSASTMSMMNKLIEDSAKSMTLPLCQNSAVWGNVDFFGMNPMMCGVGDLNFFNQPFAFLEQLPQSYFEVPDFSKFLNLDFLKSCSQVMFNPNLNPTSSSGYNLSATANHKQQLDYVKDIFNKNKDKYQAVAKATGVPAELVCAIHYRESGCKFDTYLHNGDPLGKPTVHVPVGKYFTDWTEASIDAIKSNSYYKNVKSTDLSTQLEYSERYNGLGYRNKGLSSPYVF